MNLPKVLIVEDLEAQQKFFAYALRGRAEILQARTIPEAERLFAANPDIAIIAMDACVPGDIVNTTPLTERIRETFSGPMIAISANEDNRLLLMRAGCTFECEKNFLPGTIRRIIADFALAGKEAS